MAVLCTRSHRFRWNIRYSRADRFVKLLGLLSSDHAGERANAAAAVERLRQRYGISWRDIIRKGITVPD